MPGMTKRLHRASSNQLWASLSSRGLPGSVWRHFWLSWLGDGLLLIASGSRSGMLSTFHHTQDSPPQPHSTPPNPTQNISQPQMSKAKTENAGLEKKCYHPLLVCHWHGGGSGDPGVLVPAPPG